MVRIVHRQHPVGIDVPHEPLVHAEPVLVPARHVQRLLPFVRPIDPPQVDLLRPLPLDDDRLGGQELPSDELALHEAHRVVLDPLGGRLHRLDGGDRLGIVPGAPRPERPAPGRAPPPPSSLRLHRSLDVRQRRCPRRCVAPLDSDGCRRPGSGPHGRPRPRGGTASGPRPRTSPRADRSPRTPRV